MYFPQQNQLPYRPSAMAPSAATTEAVIPGTAGASNSAPRPSPVIYNPSPHTFPTSSRPAEDIAQCSSRMKRSRKERACDLCRRKKIRCDFTQTYPDVPCSSCKSYGKTCTFNEVAKKRGPPKGYVEGLENRLRRMEELLVDLADSGKPVPEGYQELLGSSSKKCISGVRSSSGSGDKQTSSNETEGTMNQQDHAHEKTSPAPSQSRKVCTLGDPSSLSAQPAHGPVYSYFGGSSGVYLLAKFLQGDHSSKVVPVAEDDVMISDGNEYSLKCVPGQPIIWSLPDKDIVDRLVSIYFEKMNVFLPVLDEDDFKASYQKDMNSIWPPLLVAVCRSGSRLLEEDDSLLGKHNISRNELFSMFTREIENNKLLVDLLSPKIEFMQFLLLLGSSTEEWGINAQEWVVISMAAKMAQELGLHRANTTHRLPPRQAEHYRRLWWSAYAMDRWVSIAMGRPLSISDADCDVDLPAAEDGGHNYSFLVAIAKLASILGDISRVLYSPRGRSLGGENRKGINQICANFYKKLEEWQSNLSPHLRIHPGEEEQIRASQLSDELEQRFNSGAGHLQAAYYSAMILLKQRSHDIDQSFLATEASKATYFSAENILHILGALRPNAILIFNWTLTSFALFQAVGIVLVGLTDTNAELASKSKKLIQKFKTVCLRFSTYLPQDPSRVSIVEDLERFVEDAATAAAATIHERQ